MHMHPRRLPLAPQQLHAAQPQGCRSCSWHACCCTRHPPPPTAHHTRSAASRLVQWGWCCRCLCPCIPEALDTPSHPFARLTHCTLHLMVWSGRHGAGAGAAPHVPVFAVVQLLLPPPVAPCGCAAGDSVRTSWPPKHHQQLGPKCCHVACNVHHCLHGRGHDRDRAQGHRGSGSGCWGCRG